MDVSKSIRLLLLESNVKQIELLEPLNCNTKQYLNNKFSVGRWKASDLVKIAEYCGAELAFILPDGTRIPIK